METLYCDYQINGKKISLLRKDGGRFFLSLSSGVITPLVALISYDYDLESFLICDNITIWNNIEGHIYFYVDELGAPISNVFTDLNDMVFPIPQYSNYLQDYDEIKSKIADELRDIFCENYYKKNKEIKKEVAHELGL